jgi:hypothetical protein
MSAINCNIVLLPESELATKAIRTSGELTPMNTDFTLGLDTYVPHVSLYMLRLKTEDLPKVEERLAGIAAHTPALRLEADHYSQAEGYIGANYTRTADIDTLQKTVVEAINPLRDGLRPNAAARLPQATGPVRRNLEQFGYRSVGELFRPHLTFTRFTNRLPIPLEDMGAPTAFSGRYPKLALCEMGPSGTCIRIIQEFPLQ